MVQRVELGGGRKGDPRDSNPPGSVAGGLAGGSDDEQAVLHEQQVLSCEHCRWPWRRRGPEGTGGQLWRAAQDGPQWRAQHRPVPTGRHTWPADAGGPTLTPSDKNPALLSLVPAGAWKAYPRPTL